MSTASPSSTLRTVPAGFRSVPLFPSANWQWPRLALIVREKKDDVAGHLVSVDAWADARTLLGAMVDANRVVHEWLEVAIQDVERAGRSFRSTLGSLNNRTLDERWERLADAFGQTMAAPPIATGFERAAPSPSWYDPGQTALVGPRGSEGESWTLCTDDAALTAAGLPGYSASLARYLWNTAASPPTFVPLTANAPVNERCRALRDVLDRADEVIPVNATAGRILIRRLEPVEFSAFLDVLAGGSWEGLRHGRHSLGIPLSLQPSEELQDESPLSDGWLFQGRHGRWGRLVETLHLKLRIISDAADSVRQIVRETEAPLLNLTADSFRVQVGQPGCGMPRLWSGRVVLTAPGAAIPLPLAHTAERAFVRAERDRVSIFHASSARPAVSGRATVRLRAVEGNDDTPILTGTLSAPERLDFEKNDLLRLELRLLDADLEVFAHLDEAEAMAGGECRFRSLPVTFRGRVLEAARQAVGVPLSSVPFELIRLQSTPHDLYALAVLAVRTLLADSDDRLPLAVDETLSLARQVAAEYEESTPLGWRIASIFERDPRWLESLGPQRLTRQTSDAADAFDLIPKELWMDTLGLVIRMFPGTGPDAFCSDLTDAPGGALHRIFTPLLEELELLLRRTRSLIVIDWRYNREIASLIRRYRLGLERPTSGMMSGS